METHYDIMIIVFVGMVVCWCFMRCLISELNDALNTRSNLHQERSNNIMEMREFYRNQLRDVANRQFNLEETTYEIDRQIIKSLQEKYKIKINYNAYYNNKENEEENNFCCICLQQYKIEENIVEMYCNHLFHAECIEEWLNYNPTCPICRTDVINENNDVILDISDISNPFDRAIQRALSL
jgi:hypothetical protein